MKGVCKNLKLVMVKGNASNTKEISKKEGLKVPHHLAIIMDGNGRWAKRRGLPRIEGHKAGAKAVRRVVRYCAKIGVKYLTLYSFSKDNWKRPKEEVQALMNLLREYLDKEKENLKKNGIRFQVVGNVEDLPQDIREKIKNLEEYTKDCKRMTLTLALSYSGREEIVKTARQLAQECLEGKIKPQDITKELFSSYMKLPDVDLLIRTSGELRVSDFLLWQISYAEFWITKKLWPDFGGKDIRRAIQSFSKRERRFGMTSEQIAKLGGKI